MRSPISFAYAALVVGSALLGCASSSVGTGVQDVTVGASGANWQLEPRLAWADGRYSLAWGETPHLPASRVVVAKGALLSATAEIAGAMERAPSSFDGSFFGPESAWNPIDQEWAIAGNEVDDAAPYGIVLSRLDRAGHAVGRTPIVPRTEAPPGFNGAVLPSGMGGGRVFVWDGDGYAFVYAAQPVGIALRRVDSRGSFLSESAIGRAENVYPSASLAWSGDGFGVAWVEYEDATRDDGGKRAFFATADAHGSFTSAPVSLSSSGIDADYVGVRWTGRDWLTTWEEGAEGARQIWAARVNGAQISPGTRRALTSGPWSSEQPDPVWNGTSAAVAYVRRTPQSQKVALLLF